MLRHSLTRNYFKKEAPFWRDVYASSTPEGAIYSERQQKALQFVDALDLPPGARVLEVGCGAGFNSCELARRGFRVYTTDIVEEMVKMARENLDSQTLRGRAALSCCDSEALPFPDASFDLVVGIAILEWVRSTRQAVSEIVRVLRPGGYAILSATNLWALNRMLDPRLTPFLEPCKRWAKRHLQPIERSARARTHSRREVDDLLRTAGLTRMRSLTAGYGPFTLAKHKLFPGAAGARIHAALQRRADQGSLLLRHCGYTYLTVARKPGTLSQLRSEPARPAVHEALVNTR